MTTDPIAAAIDLIRSVTNRAWCAKDFEGIPDNPVDASIATILNAVVSGQLINRASRDEMLAQVRRGEGFATSGAEARWIADSEAVVYGTDAPDPIAAARCYRKRPVVIEAIQYTVGNLREVLAFTGNAPVRADSHVLKILTLEGAMEASPGDWIIKGVKGEFYPCKPDIFSATYEACHE